MKKKFLGISLASMALAVAAQAAVVVTTNNQIGNGTTPFTPTYTPLSNDVINGMSPTVIVPNAGAFALEASDGTPALTNGVFPPLATGVAGSHIGLATGGNTGGTQLTYVFPVSTIARLDMYGGWNDNGRDEQNFTVEFSANGGATWGTLIASGSFNPTVGAGLQSATRVSISDNAGALATGVNAMRVSFLGVENGYTGYAEMDLVAVPEPSGFALAGLAALGLATRRRR
jgi:hypothetical protein